MQKGTQLFFAVTIIAVGLVALTSGTFGAIWQPVPETVPERQVLAYLSTFVSLLCGAGLLSRRVAAPAALLLLAFLLIWTILFKVPVIVRAPLVEVAYQSCGESLVLIAGAWVLYAWSATGDAQRFLSLLAGNVGVRIAHALYGLALIAFGLSHFVYLHMTAPLVPEWLPGHAFWAYLTGGIYLVTGVAIVAGVAAPAAALIAAVQITLITVLVWGSILVSGHMNREGWQETILSWALTAGAWAVAASFQHRPWFDWLGKAEPTNVVPTAKGR